MREMEEKQAELGQFEVVGVDIYTVRAQLKEYKVRSYLFLRRNITLENVGLVHIKHAVREGNGHFLLADLHVDI